MTEPFYKRQPILVGCVGCLSVSLLMMCGGGVFLGLLGKGCLDTVGAQLGLDSLPGTVSESMRAGFGMQINVDGSGGADIVMPPMTPRQVTCDDLQAVVFPHLTGTLATVKIESESHEPGPDGRVQPVPLTCTWTGFPNKDTPPGSGVVSASSSYVPLPTLPPAPESDDDSSDPPPPSGE